MIRFGKAQLLSNLNVAGRDVEIIRRPYKRSLTLTLKMNGTIRVSAPKGISDARIHDFVVAQQQWIETSLLKYETVRRAFPRKLLRAGEKFPFLGQEFELVFEPCKCKPKFKISDGKLICQVRQDVWDAFDVNRDHPELMPALLVFYKTKAREILARSVRDNSIRMDLRPTALSIRAQKTRWGSCSATGRISLNWKLVIAPPLVLDYVVIHELAHLQYYNHSAAFWSLVGRFDSKYREHRAWLRENQFLADFLAAESELHPSPNEIA